MIPLGVLASGYVPPAGSSWVPDNLGNLAFWFDAADSGTLTLSGSEVTQWADKSGNARHLVRVGGVNGPSYASDTVTFDGVNDALTYATSTTFSTAYTIALVASASSQTEDYLLNLRQVESPYRDHAIISQYASKAFEYFVSYADPRLTFASSASGNHALVLVRSGTAHDARFDGSSAATATSSTTTMGAVQLFLGTSDSDANHAATTVNEVVIYSAALSGTDLTALEIYLLDKWGL